MTPREKIDGHLRVLAREVADLPDGAIEAVLRSRVLETAIVACRAVAIANRPVTVDLPAVARAAWARFGGNRR